jgi:hypothetical protein
MYCAGDVLYINVPFPLEEQFSNWNIIWFNALVKLHGNAVVVVSSGSSPDGSVLVRLFTDIGGVCWVKESWLFDIERQGRLFV